jgi:alkanesulfonate monooxygenase SsuD/methylene tetrahydromethanopterin reductase-like flavin-dependent oxidoreductase (luciferase family)
MALDFRSQERTLDKQIEQYVALCRFAEPHGIVSATAGEGYPVGPGGGHLPSPLLALAALAPQTTLEIGTGVTLLPGWHPLKLAYDAAVLDQISGGRFTLGIGLGSPPLYRRFGVDSSHLADYADEVLQALRALWSGADGFEGTVLTVEGRVGIQPIHPGGVPIWAGGSVRRSVERAARWGDGYIASSNYAFDTVARQAARYRSALQAHGKDPNDAVVVANRLTVVAEAETEARSLASRYAGLVLQAYARGGALGDEGRAIADDPEALFARFDESHCLVGTPEQVAARVRRYADAGVSQIQARVSPGDAPLEVAQRSAELLGTAVGKALA